jgi:glyoxylate/hydroxypyruvate reductase A
VNVLFVADMPDAERAAWRDALAAAAPDLQWHDDAGTFDRATIDAAVVANPPPGRLQGLPRLRLVQSLWAGVDRLLSDATLPDLPLARMVDPSMTAAMVETALWAVLSLHRGFDAYARQQRQAQWTQLPQRRAGEVGVLVLGQGEMGRSVAQALRERGYRVQGWRRGTPLQPLLADAEIVVNLLPLTADTRGLLDARFFGALPRGAAVVNLARGAHVRDDDLLAALDAGHIGHAVLDVFATEPLPPDHPYWRHERVTVLPHVAALTDLHSAARIVAANLRALRDGTPVANLVDRARGY